MALFFKNDVSNLLFADWSLLGHVIVTRHVRDKKETLDLTDTVSLISSMNQMIIIWPLCSTLHLNLL